MTILEPEYIADVQNRLGECVIWDHRTETLLWTDIESACLWKWRIGKGEPESHSLPERLGSFALTSDPDIYLGAFENGFARFSVSPPDFRMLSAITSSTPHLRMNDGRVDRTGQFWAGSMMETAGTPPGSLWKFNTRGDVRSSLSGLQIPNSLCWNITGDIMYFADSPNHAIWKFAFDPVSGPIGEPEIFAATAIGVHPDGSCIDAEDHLWNAQWGAGEIVRYRPDGQIDRKISLPVSQPSCVTFGGPDLNLLCITTARVDLNEEDLIEQPLAGALLIYDVNATGRKEEIYDKGI